MSFVTEDTKHISPRIDGLGSHKRHISKSRVGVIPAEYEQYIFNLLNSNSYAVMSTLLTFFLLVGDDCKILFFPKEADDVFNGLYIFSFVLVIFELALQSLSHKNYFLSTYFWIEMLANVTVILDCTWVSDSLLFYDHNYSFYLNVLEVYIAISF